MRKLQMPVAGLIAILAAFGAWSLWPKLFPQGAKVAVLPDSPVYFVSAGGHDTDYFSATNTALCRYDRGRFVAGLANKVIVSDDGLSVQMHLDSGSRYADGTAVEAEDIVQTLMAIKAERTRSGPYKAKYHNVVAVQALSTTQVLWRFYERTGREAGDACDLWVMPRSYLASVTAHLEYPWQDWQAIIPPGTGAKYAAGSFKAGELRLLPNRHAVGATLAPPAKGERKAQVLLWNGRSALAADLAIRKVLDEALRQQAWTSHGGLSPATSLLAPGKERDPQAASTSTRAPNSTHWQQTLADLRERHGRRLSLQLLASTEFAKIHADRLRSLKATLASLDVGVEIVAVPFAEWGEALRSKTYDAIFATLHFREDPVVGLRSMLAGGSGVRSILQALPEEDLELNALLQRVDTAVKGEASPEDLHKLDAKLAASVPLTVLTRNY